MQASRGSDDDTPLPESVFPPWFSAFLVDRAVRKPSPHTGKAYRQDFVAIAALLAGDGARVGELTPAAITKEAMRAAFAAYADSHEAASIRRCWSTWNTLCSFLYSAELLEANPMPLIGRPKVPKSLPKGLGAETVSGLLAAIDAPAAPTRKTDWPERDRAIVLTALLAGLRAQELRDTNVADLHLNHDGGAVLHVRGKGNKDRRIPLEESLIKVLECYLDSRALRFPANTKRRGPSTGIAAWPATAALFVGSNGARITRGVLQYRVLRAFKKAGLNSQRARGALIHALRHTYATQLAEIDTSVYALMKLLGHESMVTSQRYVDGAGAENRAAAARNPLYDLLS